MKKKYFPNIDIYLKNLEEKSKPPKKNSKPERKPKRNKTLKVNELTKELGNEQTFNKLLKTYKDFVNKNFKSHTFEYDGTDIFKNKEEIPEENPDLKSKIKTNINTKVKEPDSDFKNFLDTIIPDFLEENIICEIPDIPQFYGKESMLGKHKNNSSDYLRRRTELIKDNAIIISEDLELNLPLSEINIEMDNDNNLNYGKDLKELNVDENDGGSPSIINDKYIIIQRKNSINAISEIWKVRSRKEILYIGIDPYNKKNILRIYGKRFDENGKIKIIEFNMYPIKLANLITLEKTVKDIFNVDSLSKEDLIQRNDEIIKKFKELVF